MRRPENHTPRTDQPNDRETPQQKEDREKAERKTRRELEELEKSLPR